MNTISLFLSLSLVATSADQPAWQCWPVEAWLRRGADAVAIENDVRPALIGASQEMADTLLRRYGYHRWDGNVGVFDDLDGSATAWRRHWKVTYVPAKVIPLLAYASWFADRPQSLVLWLEQGRIVAAEAETTAVAEEPRVIHQERARPTFFRFTRTVQQEFASPVVVQATGRDSFSQDVQIRLQEWLDRTRQAANPAAERADHPQRD